MLIVHGGPHGSIDPVLTLMRYMFLKCGYALLMPNFSGSAGYGEDVLNKALGQIGILDAKEIITVLEKVLNEK